MITHNRHNKYNICTFISNSQSYSSHHFFTHQLLVHTSLIYSSRQHNPMLHNLYQITNFQTGSIVMVDKSKLKTEPKLYEIEDETALGTITSISKYPDRVTVDMKDSRYSEIVKVGPNQMLGEIVLINGHETTIQVYGKLSGLQVGDSVVRTKQPLTVELGPGLLGNMCDAFQRSFEVMADGGSNIFVPPYGLQAHTTLDKQKLWEFEPQHFKVGDHISGGDIFGKVYETPSFAHWIMLHPKKEGTIVYLAPPGYYTLEEEILVVELMGVQTRVTMVQRWPVRQPRQPQERISTASASKGSLPYYTGLRVVDGLYPVGLGQMGTICGGTGTGKATMCHSIAKNTNSDVVVYAAIGKRGNELSEMRMSYSEKCWMRTHTIASTSDMPIHCQEIVGYTGITASEYFRDQGYNATLILDSLSSWIEPLKHTERVTSFMPCSSGYPAYLGARIVSLCERAGRVLCLGSPYRCGSVTLITTVRPPGGDLSDASCSAAFGITDSLWMTSKKLAQQRIYPPVSYETSFTKHFNLEEEMATHHRTVKEILLLDSDLHEIVQLVGQDSLGEAEKLALEVASLIKEVFLQQDLQTVYDRDCPAYKTLWMMKNIATFYHNASKIVLRSTANSIISATREILHKLRKMKYEDPADGEYVIVERMKRLNKEIATVFCSY